MRAILGTSSSAITRAQEKSLAKQGIILYGGKPKTALEIRALRQIVPSATLFADINGWNEPGWDAVYKVWASVPGAFYIYPCATAEHQNFDEPGIKGVEDWVYTGTLLNRFVSTMPLGRPFVTGALPIYAGQKALTGLKALSLDLNAWAIVEAVAKKQGRTVREMVTLLMGYTVSELIGYLVKEDLRSDCTWFNLGCSAYQVKAARPPDFRTPADIPVFCKRLGIVAFQYYHAPDVLTVDNKPGPELAKVVA